MDQHIPNLFCIILVNVLSEPSSICVYVITVYTLLFFIFFSAKEIALDFFVIYFLLWHIRCKFQFWLSWSVYPLSCVLESLNLSCFLEPFKLKIDQSSLDVGFICAFHRSPLFGSFCTWGYFFPFSPFLF